MFDESRNPFDRISSVELHISVWVGPSALLSLTEQEKEHLARIAQFEFVDVVAIALAGADSAGVTLPGTGTGQVRITAEHVILEEEKSLTLVGSRATLEYFTRQSGVVSADVGVEHLLAAASHGADVLVGAANSVASVPERASRRHFCTLSGLTDLLRLLCVAYGRFEIVPRYTVNEGFYYLYRRDRMFPNFRRAWFYGRPQLETRLQGLSTRLNFLCRSCDQASIEARKTPNNDTDARCLFYLGYHYMLATGVFDDLAAIANEVHSLGLHRQKTTLRRRRNGRSPISEALKTPNPVLSDFLDDPLNVAAIESFYPIRDSLQHREFPTTMGKTTSGYRMPSVMIAPEQAIRDLALSLEGGAPTEQWIGENGMATVELNWLVPTAMSAVAKLVNGYLGRIPWASLSTDRATGDELWSRFDEGVGAFLGWPAEPLVFG